MMPFPQFQLQPRAADGSLAHGNLLPVARGAGPYADIVARKASATSGGSGAGATAKATGGGKATATGASGAKTTASGTTAAAAKATATSSSSSASSTPSTVTTSGASAGHDVGFLKSGLLTAAGAAVGFAWFL